MGHEACRNQSGACLKTNQQRLDWLTANMHSGLRAKLRCAKLTFPALEEDLVGAFQALDHVVGVEDRHFSGMGQALGTHHLHTVTQLIS